MGIPPEGWVGPVDRNQQFLQLGESLVMATAGQKPIVADGCRHQNGPKPGGRRRTIRSDSLFRVGGIAQARGFRSGRHLRPNGSAHQTPAAYQMQRPGNHPGAETIADQQDRLGTGHLLQMAGQQIGFHITSARFEAEVCQQAS
jgi:hypothetical protein